ncbi:hypothetical protein FF38_09707 [Lucilia cuprina]|uniref:Uncharacterized protein n=1 Tax=Lucilia cuprina TaxID=7375 RepID=A0A0L0C4U5_LUCCU|nr:hypothetical protein FF38_09707 [Lucilia cuprina]
MGDKGKQATKSMTYVITLALLIFRFALEISDWKRFKQNVFVYPVVMNALFIGILNWRTSNREQIQTCKSSIFGCAKSYIPFTMFIYNLNTLNNINKTKHVGAIKKNNHKKRNKQKLGKNSRSKVDCRGGLHGGLECFDSSKPDVITTLTLKQGSSMSFDHIRKIAYYRNNCSGNMSFH